jgi:hypothetical protein
VILFEIILDLLFFERTSKPICLTFQNLGDILKSKQQPRCQFTGAFGLRMSPVPPESGSVFSSHYSISFWRALTRPPSFFVTRRLFSVSLSLFRQAHFFSLTKKSKTTAAPLSRDRHFTPFACTGLCPSSITILLYNAVVKSPPEIVEILLKYTYILGNRDNSGKSA